MPRANRLDRFSFGFLQNPDFLFLAKPTLLHFVLPFFWRRLAFEDSLPNVEKKRPSSTLEDLGNLGEKRVISGTAVKPLTK